MRSQQGHAGGREEGSRALSGEMGLAMPYRRHRAASVLVRSGRAPSQTVCRAFRLIAIRLVASGVGGPMSRTASRRLSLAATGLAMASGAFIVRGERSGREVAFSEGSTIPRMETRRTSGL